MRRYPPFDPPEYAEWVPDPAVMDAYRQRFSDQPGLRYARESLGPEGLERIYRGLVRNRLYDIVLKRWVRTGVLTKAWLGTGEEAATIGAVHALAKGDVVGPMIRNVAACFERGISLEDCFKVYLATGDTITRGRDLHLGDLRCGVMTPISHVGDLVPVLAGQALAFQLRAEKRVALTWVGDGATRTGACHEGLAMAAARSLPLIVLIQDNGVALGTRCDESLRQALRSTAAGYGGTGLECDGNHVIDVYHSTRTARQLCLKGKGPVIIYAETFRMGGHATHDEAEARALFSDETFRAWGARDPVGCFEEWLRGDGMLRDPDATLSRWEESVALEVETAADRALEAKETQIAEPAGMEEDVFASDRTDEP